jgi:hypothetical protein
VLTGIQLSFGGAARARALGLYSVVLSAGAVAGQSLGGLLISADVLGSTWRPAFLVNVPIGVLLIWLAWRWLPVGQGRPGRLDLAGGAVLSAAMLLLVVPLVLGQDAGWPAWTQACLAASVPAFAALWLVERKVSARGGRPLVDPRLIARPEIGWGLASQAASTATYFAVLFTLALYLQQGLGRSAAYSGLALVSWVAAFGIPGPALGRLPARVRALAAPAGAVILAAGFAGLAVSLYSGDTSGALLMTLLGVAGLGLGTMFTRHAQPPDQLSDRRACLGPQWPVQHHHPGRRCAGRRRVRYRLPRAGAGSSAGTQLRHHQPGPGGHRDGRRRARRPVGLAAATVPRRNRPAAGRIGPGRWPRDDRRSRSRSPMSR